MKMQAYDLCKCLVHVRQSFRFATIRRAYLHLQYSCLHRKNIAQSPEAFKQQTVALASNLLFPYRLKAVVP